MYDNTLPIKITPSMLDTVEEEMKNSLHYDGSEFESTYLYKLCKPFIKDIVVKSQRYPASMSMYDADEEEPVFIFVNVDITDEFNNIHHYSDVVSTRDIQDAVFAYKALKEFYPCIKFLYNYFEKGNY